MRIEAKTTYLLIKSSGVDLCLNLIRRRQSRIIYFAKNTFAITLPRLTHTDELRSKLKAILRFKFLQNGQLIASRYHYSSIKSNDRNGGVDASQTDRLIGKIYHQKIHVFICWERPLSGSC